MGTFSGSQGNAKEQHWLHGRSLDYPITIDTRIRDILLEAGSSSFAKAMCGAKQAMVRENYVTFEDLTIRGFPKLHTVSKTLPAPGAADWWSYIYSSLYVTDKT